MELVEAGIPSLEEGSTAKAFLLATKSQLTLAPFLLDWAKSIFDRCQRTRYWGNRLNLADDEGMGLDSLEDSAMLRDYKSRDRKTKPFRTAVPPSICDFEAVMLHAERSKGSELVY